MSTVNRNKGISRQFALEAYNLNPLHSKGNGGVDRLLIMGATRAQQEEHRLAVPEHHRHMRLEHSMEVEVVDGNIERFTEQALEYMLKEISRTREEFKLGDIARTAVA